MADFAAEFGISEKVAYRWFAAWRRSGPMTRPEHPFAPSASKAWASKTQTTDRTTGRTRPAWEVRMEVDGGWLTRRPSRDAPAEPIR